jgi:hypothetical protein
VPSSGTPTTACCSSAPSSSASAAGPARTPVVVDDFESGSLDGWTIDRRGSGNWFIYRDGKQAPDPKQSDPFVPFRVPNPPQGQVGAVTDTKGPGTRILLGRANATAENRDRG